MKLHRIGLKYYVENPHTVDLSELIPVFHRWIQNGSVEGMLIDVADYKHVHHGPGVVLVGHECDYHMDMGEGRPGLKYLRKRDTGGDLRECFRKVFGPLLGACGQLEREQELRIRFRTEEARLTIFDRLRAPNTPETFAAIRSDLEAVLRELYGGAQIQLERANDESRECCAVRISAADSPPLATLIDRARQQKM